MGIAGLLIGPHVNHREVVRSILLDDGIEAHVPGVGAAPFRQCL